MALERTLPARDESDRQGQCLPTGPRTVEPSTIHRDDPQHVASSWRVSSAVSTLLSRVCAHLLRRAQDCCDVASNRRLFEDGSVVAQPRWLALIPTRGC